MQLGRRTFLASGAAGLLTACTPAGRLASVSRPLVPALPPLDFDPARLMRVTVCLRPFRASGPRLEAEAVGEKVVVHNYGHGGSGWSLSWGCADQAVSLAMAALAEQGSGPSVAVIGAGAIGMTTALRLLEAGAEVSIYAAEFTPDTRSARATGVWSPSSRVGLSSAMDDAANARWEQWARRSWLVHQQHIGLAGDPVEFLRQYNLSGGEEPDVDASRPYARLGARLRDINPRWPMLEGTANPFPDRTVRSGQTMVFNVSEYADWLTRMVLLRGGRMERRSFADRAQVLELPQRVIVNCTGYGARTLWQDESVVPVRGQINWLIPQPEARYALYYDAVQAVSRRDGVVVQYLGPNDDWGYGDSDEVADPAETERALSRMRSVFA
ncbi:MAG: FAD-dependent oxidoreductase [Erythrobacter sp.]|nr:FAD-dependent oxidoreductase [Erythrobacter sp.]